MQPTREKEETLSTPAPPHMHTSIKPISSATATSLGLSVMCQQVSKTFVTNRDWWTLSPIYLYYNDRHTHTRSVFFSCICTHTQTLAWIKKTSLVEVMSNSLVCQSEWERLGRKCQTEREVGNSPTWPRDAVMWFWRDSESRKDQHLFREIGNSWPTAQSYRCWGGGTTVYSYVGQTRVIGHACLIKVTQVPLSPINILFFFFLTHPSPTFNFHLSPFPPARSLVSFGQMTAVFSVFCQ